MVRVDYSSGFGGKMAFRVAAQRMSQGNAGCFFGLRRLTHGLAIPAPISNVIDPVISPSLSLPEADSDFSCQFPGFASGSGSMELMAVPKKKVLTYSLNFPKFCFEKNLFSALAFALYEFCLLKNCQVICEARFVFLIFSLLWFLRF